MATTRVEMTANGSTDTFNFNFPYISKGHVRVYLDGVAQTGYTFPTPGSVKLTSVPPSGTTVVIQRETPTGVSLTEYQTGVTLTTQDLTTDSLQARYLIEEEADQRAVAVSDEAEQRAAAVSAEAAARAAADEAVALDASVAVVAEANARASAVTAANIARAAGDADLDARKIDRDDIPAYLVEIGDDAAAVTFQPSGTGAVGRSVAAKLRDIKSVKDFGAVGDGVVDDTAAIQAAVNTGICLLPPGIYCVSSEIVIPDGGGLVGRSAVWKRRLGYTYNAGLNSVLKYVGAGGTNSCVVRASNVAVGTVGTDFNPTGDGITDDLTNIVLTDFHVDANGLADYGVYIYRAGNQATVDNITAEKAVKANHVHLGCYAARFGTFGAYEAVNEGVVCGWDIFGWSSVEATNFSYSASFLLAGNGTGGTYVAGTSTDLEGSGGRFKVGRGSTVRITSEGNDGRACVLAVSSVGGGTSGPVDYVLEYIEGNADGPYVDYRDSSDGIRLRDGFVHPGNGGTLLPQNITIEAKTDAGVVTSGAGPVDPKERLVIERLFGDMAGVGFQIKSNTNRYTVRDCARNLTFSASTPLIDGFVATENQVGAGIYFTAAATPSVWSSSNGTIARSAAGVYVFTFTRAFRAVPTPMLGIVLSAALDTKVRITGLSQTNVTIRTYDNAGALADTGDRISFIASGPLVY